MIEIHRHIEILLLDNDCVIVPDFGGFVAHHVPARYDEQERMMLPPARTVGFNPLLRMNDSLLVHSYMTAYDISYPEAMRRIEQEVDQMRQELQGCGHFSLHDVGTLSMNAEGNCEFAPAEAGILTPAYYGLDSVQIKRLADADDAKGARLVELEQAAPADSVAADDDQTAEEKAITVKMSWVRNSVAAVAAAVVFLLISTPIMNGGFESLKMSKLNHHIFYKLIPQDTNMAQATPVSRPIIKKAEQQPVASKVAESNQAAEAATQQPIGEASTQKPASATATQQEPATHEEPATTYAICLASQVKRSNAELFVEQLRKHGYTDAEVYVRDNVVRVLMGAYASQADAYARLNSLRNCEGFEDAWVYKKAEI
ncbi:MAG: SPOR domain-containing protein [Prevotella sp.]|nr:SPOR domain-containing protein [Prevotella sp.]